MEDDSDDVEVDNVDVDEELAYDLASSFIFGGVVCFIFGGWTYEKLLSLFNFKEPRYCSIWIFAENYFWY